MNNAYIKFWEIANQSLIDCHTWGIMVDRLIEQFETFLQVQSWVDIKADLESKIKDGTHNMGDITALNSVNAALADILLKTYNRG